MGSGSVGPSRAEGRSVVCAAIREGRGVSPLWLGHLYVCVGGVVVWLFEEHEEVFTTTITN